MKAIIIGSGPAGLTTAHCFIKAGITDVLILERRTDPLDHGGAGIGLYPHALRIMDQLGVLGELEKYGAPLHKSFHIKANGKVFSQNSIFDCVSANNGYPNLVMARTHLVRGLYVTLPDKETRILPGKKVVEIEQTDTGVRVKCADGSEFTGDIVVGCDGVHSVVRRLAIESLSDKSTRYPISEFRCMFGNGPLLAGMPANDMTEVHDWGLTFHILSSRDRAYWLFYTIKDKDEPRCRQYTAKDADKLAEKYANHLISIGSKLTFGDLWRTKSSGSPYDLEEDCAERWYRGRAVLAGDSAHKMNPNLALGGNSAIESAAALANELHALLHNSARDMSGKFTTVTLEGAFAKYQAARKERAQAAVAMSASYARQAAWATRFDYVMNRFLAPLVSGRRIADTMFSPWLSEATALRFVDTKVRVGKVPWKSDGSAASAP